MWSDNTNLYQDARIIFKDFETSNWTWDPVANAYYWHRFYSHQPDLNYENPEVHEAMLKIVDFWFGLGVDGLRLDAVPYLYERDGTNCENLPETHAFLKKLRKHVDKHFKDKFLLAEANQWPEDACEYFGNDDECHMAFHFPMMPRMYMALQMEDRFPLIDILMQTPTIPENCQWATFLRNHDELTLEMVTDAERDYMYRSYAEDPQTRINLGIRRRLAPLMKGDDKKIELMNSLLFSLPGTPVIYYGDEIGMGDNIYLGDRNGVRTPMQWTGTNRNAGFSKATPQRLFLPVIIDPEYTYEIINVKLQKTNPRSLLWRTKRLIELRKNHLAFSRGTLEFLFPDNHKVLTFLRCSQQETLLIVINLSRYIQYVELDLSQFENQSLIELFGNTKFPPIIKDQPYFLTLGGYSFYYFQIYETQEEMDKNIHQPKDFYADNLADFISNEFASCFEKTIINYLPSCRWFKSKIRTIKSSVITDQVLIKANELFYLLFVDIEFNEGEKEKYLLPVTILPLHELPKNTNTNSIIFYITERNKYAVLDALILETACDVLLTMFNNKQIRTKTGDIKTHIMSSIKTAHDSKTGKSIKLLTNDQSNSSIIFNDNLILKLFRKCDPGLNPDVEINTYLTTKKFRYTPKFIGDIQYKNKDNCYTLGMLQEYIPNQNDAWGYILSCIKIFYDNTLEKHATPQPIDLPLDPLINHDLALDQNVFDLLGPVTELLILLGERTAELHAMLSKSSKSSDFNSESFSFLDQRSLYQSVYSKANRVFTYIRKNIRRFTEQQVELLNQLLEKSFLITQQCKTILNGKIGGKKIRCHGDFHLGQILFTGNDFIIIDFEGDPMKPISERRIKMSPLSDVASMLRSFHYAASSIFYEIVKNQSKNHTATLSEWSTTWYRTACTLFLKGYLAKLDKTNLLPSHIENLLLLLKIYMLDKALSELDYEINNRPDKIMIPSRGIMELIT